jgi:hypothetical protein
LNPRPTAWGKVEREQGDAQVGVAAREMRG